MRLSRGGILSTGLASTLLTLLGTVLLGACNGLPIGLDIDAGDDRRPEGITLTTNVTQVAPGDPLVLTLHNHSASPVGYNLCFVEFQPRANGQWSEQTVQFLRLCTEDLPILPSGQSVSSAETVPAMPPGTYRVLTTVVVAGERLTVASEPFGVRP